jgi:hypothetical protein
LVAGHRLRATLHQDRAEVDVVHVATQLAERLGAARDLITARDVGGREA